MLEYNDKMTLTGINAINKKGKIINYNLVFPLNDDDFYLPEDITEISVFEYHEGYENYGFKAFKICMGKITSIREICESHDNDVKFERRVFEEIVTPDDNLCYYDEDDKKNIFSKLNQGDIVVKDLDDFRSALISVSDNYRIIKSAIERIRTYHTYDDTLSAEEKELSEKRMQMCIKQRTR